MGDHQSQTTLDMYQCYSKQHLKNIFCRTCRRFCSTASDDVGVEEIGVLNVSLDLLNVDCLHQQVDGVLKRHEKQS